MADHIQVGDAAPRVQYVANGSQTAFTFLFPIFTAADMEVWLDNARQSDTAYAISGIGISGGGTVLFSVPPAAGALVTLRRQVTIARTTDYQEDGIIRAKLLNDELDYQTAALQQVAEAGNRAVKRSFLSSSSADLTLPEPSAGKAIKWNVAGTGLENSAADTDQVLAGATAQALAASGSANMAVISAEAAATSAATASASAGSAQTYAAQAQTAASGGIRISAADTTAGYLNAKLAAGGNIALTVNNAGADETLTVAVSGLGSAAALASDSDISLAANSDGRIATQKAVKAYVAANAGVSSTDFTALQQDVIQNYLLDAVNGAWAAGGYSNGGYDAFNTDTIGANSTNQTYESGKYYDNPGGTGVYTPTGTAFGNMATGGGLAAAFDGAVNQSYSASAYDTNALSHGGGYVGKAFSSPQTISRVDVYGTTDGGGFTYIAGSSVTLSIYGKASAPSGPTDGTLLGTTSFTTSSPGGASQLKSINCSGGPYQYVWVFNSSGGSGSADAYVCEVVYYTTTSPLNMTLLSGALNPAPATAVTQVKLMVLYKAIDAATLNTDFTAEATADGANWAAGTLIDTGVVISGYKVLWAVIDVSGRSSGTTVKYRLKTLNAKTQQIKGVGLMTK